jgi:hypothetical protein
MSVENLPDFNEQTGPASAKYFKACALSKKLLAERQRLFEEGKRIREQNPRGIDQFSYQNSFGKPRQPNAAESLIAEFIQPEVAEASPVQVNHEALARCREIGATTQEIDDAIRQLGDKILEFHVRACKEYSLSVRDHYRPIGERISAAIVELAQAVDEHDSFIEALCKKEVHHFSWLQLVERPSWNTIRRMLRSAYEAGHLAKGELDRWRDK